MLYRLPLSFFFTAPVNFWVAAWLGHSRQNICRPHATPLNATSASSCTHAQFDSTDFRQSSRRTTYRFPRAGFMKVYSWSYSVAILVVLTQKIILRWNIVNRHMTMLIFFWLFSMQVHRHVIVHNLHVLCCSRSCISTHESMLWFWYLWLLWKHHKLNLIVLHFNVFIFKSARAEAAWTTRS